jgi:phage-related protein
MASAVDIAVNIVTKLNDSGMKQAESKMGRFGSGLKKAAVPALAVAGAIGAFGAAAVKSASDLQQSMGAVDSVFGKNAGTVKAWSQDAATNVGLAASEYQNLAAVIGSQFSNLGVPMDQVAGKTNDLITMGADLAATYGGTTAEAVEALSSVLRGETDPIEKYGVSINQAAIAAQMAKDGTEDLTGAQGKAAKTQATLALLSEQSAKATGQFAEEQDSAAGQAQIAAAQYENMKAALGTALLPAISAVMGALGKLAQFMGKHKTATQIAIGAIFALAAAILVLNIAMTVYTAVTTLAASATVAAWVAAIWPILLVVAAVALVVAAIVILWKKSATFRSIVLGVWSAIKTAVMATWRVIAAGGKAFYAAARAVFSGIRSAVGAVANAIKAIWKAVWLAASLYVKAYVLVARTVFNLLKAAVGFVVDKVSALIKKIAGIKVPGAIKSAFDTIRSAVERAISKVGDIIAKIRNISVPGAIKSAFDAIAGAAEKIVGFIHDIASAIGNIPTPHINWPSPPKWLDKIMPGMVAPPPPVPGAVGTPRVRARAGVGSSVAAPVVINVNGALDPDAVARQIRRLLASHDRRVGVRA